MLCAESLCSAAISSGVHAGPPRMYVALSGPNRAVDGGTGVAAGVLLTAPAALSATAFFLSEASSTWMHDAATDAPSRVATISEREPRDE
jgi:hypothetical protein